MVPTMDEQTMRTVINILRQRLADVEWENTLLQAEVIRLNSVQANEGEGDSP